ncbi:MAG TPA: acyltransferase family protein [Mycobacteriales bacterium]|nr:acyltransferase family protein [Mycobacteriales bacterium]
MHTKTHAHWRGLDGLRAVAVVAVVIYHFSPMTLPGGYLGVDIFFVISGYLITRLITEEFLRRHRLDAPAFYRRRARRLLPALAIVLASVGASSLIWRDQLATVRPGIVFSALFSANWWLAFAHQPYFVATGRPSMLQHLWSLGVEEQFYLVWPLVVAATLGASWRRLTRRGLDPRAVTGRLVAPLCGVAVGLALVSTGLTWLLADESNVPYGGDGSTLYYGTDTHAMGLLLGAALGAWAVGRSSAGAGRRRVPAPLVELAGVGALIVLLVLTRSYGPYSHSLYRGGFLLVSALVAVVVAAATGPAGRLGRVLDARPLRWIGVRSYSIYLWHWPIAVVTRPALDTSMPTWLDQLLRIALTLALSDATYRYVETPIRKRGFVATWRSLLGRLRRIRPSGLPRPAFAGITVMPAVVVAGLVIALPAPRPAAALATQGGTHLVLHPLPATNPPVGPRLSSRPGARRMPKISGFGDSVMLDARQTLAQAFGGGTIDAVVGRQPGPILDDVMQQARAHRLNPVVIIHAGNNGLIDPDQLKRVLGYLGGAGAAEVQVVLVLNDHLDPYDHSWQTPNNTMLARVVPRFHKAVFVNWNKVAGEHPGWLYSDDLHLKPSGAVGYAKLLAATYRQSLPTPGASSK